MKELTIILICLFLSFSSQAIVITVDDDGPADFNNIQAAINDANDGDEVIVKDGIYTGDGNRDIDFLGKAITVRSENGLDNCTIDVNASDANHYRCFYFQNNEGASSRLEGFTIKNAYVDGVFYINIIGGGILCVNASPTITECKLVLNQAVEGGGIFLLNSSAIVSNCLVTENQAGYGAGISVRGPNTPVITNCEISDNIATGNGGGMSTEDGVEVYQCIFINNEAVGRGGGIVTSYPEGYTFIVERCEFFANQATSGGGMALSGDGFNMRIGNCTFWGNTVTYYGGGIYVNNCGDLIPEIVNCTFHNNVALESAGAVCGFGGAGTNPKLSNCIIWGNEPNSDPGIKAIPDGGKCGHPRVTADSSILQSEWQGEIRLIVENCFIADPCFADPDANDFHLKSQAGRWDPNSESWVIDNVTSPAIDAGNPADPIGYEPFPNGGIVNMGAYGGTAEASKSYFGTTPCETIVAGDINGDCKVDYVDIALLGKHWLEDNNP